MKKISTKLVSLLCAFLLAFSAVGCTPAGDGGPTVYEYEMWTTYNTLKVVQNPALNGNYEKMPVAINVTMAKNESEMGSFYVTNTGKAISSFNLTAAELTNENGDKFPVEQMQVLAQKYVNVVSKSQGNTLKEYPLGYQPDPLVLMDLYRGEKEDKIGTNCNQGFTVDFTTTAETPAGIYQGTFILELDSVRESIPVTVEVWDYALPEKSRSDGCFLIYERQVMQSEGTSEIDEYWYPAYFEQALKYKATPYMVPDSLHGKEAFFASVKKYWDHPNFSRYGMPHQSFIDGTSYSSRNVVGYLLSDITADPQSPPSDADYKDFCGEMDYYYDCLYYFMQKSAEDGADYLSKTYLYPIDEPQTDKAVQQAINWCTNLHRLFDVVAEDVREAGVFANCDPDFTAQCFDSLDNIDIVITASGDEPAMRDCDFVYCPTFQTLAIPSAKANIEAHAQRFDKTMWMYSHIRPNNPCPTMHIDDFLVATRSMKWMQKYYDIAAYLYYDYCTALSGSVYKQDYHGENRYEIVNKSPGLSANGDGFLVYPAARYSGATEPVSSMRLLAYRDGQDDMDIMYMLDDIYAEYEQYYGVEENLFELNTVMEGLFERLLVEHVALPDDATFQGVRESLTDAVLNATKADNKFVYSIKYDGTMANYSFFTAPGYQVKVNGTVIDSEVSGQGLKHTFSMDYQAGGLLTSVELVCTTDSAKNKTMELYENSTSRGVDIMADDFNVAVSENSTFTKDTANKELNFTINSIGLSEGETNDLFLLFKEVAITFDSIPSFKVLEYDVENKTNSYVKMTIEVFATDDTSWSQEVGLPANTKWRVNFLNRLSANKTYKNVKIWFENVEQNSSGGYDMLNGRNIIIKNMQVR